MSTPVLLVLTALRWFGAARMPRALAQAGFEVTLLTPPGSLAEKSSYITKIAYLPENATPMEWVHAFAATVKATGTRLVMPCDDGAFRLLYMLALAPPENLQPALHGELTKLIADSLGDPAHYPACIDKTRLPPAASALGVRVPAGVTVSDVAGAEAFAAAHGYPIVLRRRHPSGGDAAFVQRASDVSGAFAAVTRTVSADAEADRNVEILVRSYVRGLVRYYQASAWNGALLAGFAIEKVRPQDGAGRPPAVNRYYRSDALREVAAKLARGFGISGFFSLEGIDAENGEFHLLEVNRRLVGGAHRGNAFGVDHCSALHAALQGLPSPSRTDLDTGEEHLSVAFPQEWLRDPDSPWLRDYPVDVPWDDPELFEAMLELQPSR